jgi:ethanolaminephosphotransferase
MSRDTQNKKYRYSTSDKSILDQRHEGLWNDTVVWIYRNYPKITPNQLTLMGALPVIGLIFIHLTGILGSFIFPLLGLSLVWYLNMDAMDGKLARHSNRSSPIGQVLDHGIDALIGGLLSVMVTHFLGFEYAVFNIISITLTTALFYQATLKEHVTGQMIVSMKFYLGKTEDTSVILSTTEMLYALSTLFFFGWFALMGDMFFCFPLGMALMGGLVILNDMIYRQIVSHQRIENRNNGNYQNTDTDSSSSSSSSSRGSRQIVKRRAQIYDTNMRPTGQYTEFDVFPEPEQDNIYESTNARSNGLLTDLKDFKNTAVGKSYYNFGLTLLLSLITYILTAGSVIQLVMTIVYTTTITVDQIFLNTLKLDRSDKKSRMLMKRFTNRSILIFASLKILTVILGIIGVIFGILDSIHLSHILLTIIDMVFMTFIGMDLIDKADVVESYFQ